VPKKIDVFRSQAGEAEVQAAYRAILRRWPVAYEESCIPTRLGDTHLIACGPESAPPVALLHPSGSSSVIWCRNVEALSREYRIYAIDTISEPNESVPTRRITARNQDQSFAEWMTDLFDGLHITQAHLVGNSFGGFLALNTVLHFPERVGKVVLIAPADTFTTMWGWYKHFPLANVLDPLLGTTRLRLKAIEWIWQDFPLEEDVGRLRALTAIHGHHRHWFPRVFTDQELSEIRAPILLLVGDNEVIYKPQDAIRRARRLIPTLQAEIIPNANHIAEYTASDVVNEKILAFLGRSEVGV
jgi:pimeloyl-ACP methyl ester carboxylesterase